MQYDQQNEDDDLDETIPCPECKREIHEDSVSCPGCGHYLTEREKSGPRRSTGCIMLVVIAMIISLLFPLIGNLINRLFNL